MTIPPCPPAPPAYFGYSRLEHSGLVTAGPSYLQGFLITPDGTAGDVGVYNGEDDSPFGHFHTIHTGASVTLRIDFARPLYFNRGIYLTLDDHITECTCKWSPVPAELGEPQSPFPDVPEPSP